MTKPACPDCGSTDVAERLGKNGTPYLIDTKKPHSIFCPGRKKGAKPAKIAPSAKPSPEREEAVAALMVLRYKVTEAQDMLKDIPEGEPDAMVRAALKRKGEG